MTETTYRAHADAIAAEIETDPLLKRQFEIEAGMVEEGRRLFNERLQKLRPHHSAATNQSTVGRESQSVASRSLIKAALDPLTKAVQEFCAPRKKAGRGHAAIPNLRKLEPEQAAFIALKFLFDSYSGLPSVQTLAIAIGRAVEDEVRITQFAAQYPGLYRAIEARFKSQSTKHHRKVFTAAIRRADDEAKLVDPEWAETDALHMGLALITLAVESTGYFELAEVTTHRAARKVVRPAAGTVAYVNHKHELAQFMLPSYMPCVVPPKRWTSPTNGGYHYSLASKYRLVKNRDRDYQAMLRKHHMPVVYDAINALQETAWQVNAPILALMDELATGGSYLGGLPDGRIEDVPPAPTDIPRDKDARTEEQETRLRQWKAMAQGTYEANVEREQKAKVLARTLIIAQEFIDDEAIYFPHTLDFRGRAYPVPMFLNPQGCDWQKALLRFADGKKLGEGGAYWLAVHGANLMAKCPITKQTLDKGPFEDRVAWVEANRQRIIDAATAPLADLWWTHADGPWQFLAFCQEWVGYLTEGVDYRSHLPVALDGSCNGLQHFSAALNDEIGGAAVNLVPHDKPADIYTAVQVKVIASLLEIAKGADETKAELARKWVESGQVDRTMCKRPVMTMPYGSKQFGIKDQIVSELKKRGFKFPDGSDGFMEANLLAAVIWQAIGQVVIKAREAMDWLQSVARVAVVEDRPLQWTTPSGFPVYQRYNDVRSLQITTRICGKVFKPRLDFETEDLARHKQVNGIAPNFVHSMDGSALALTINLGVVNGISAFAMIHDSFGTHAADTTRFFRALRVAFVDMYKENDVLQQFLDEVGAVLSDEGKAAIPPIPAKGSLDLDLVEESDYFFA